MALSFAEQWAAQVAAGIEATNQSRLEEAAASGEDTFQALSTDGSGDVLTLDVQTGVPTTPAEELVAAGPSQEDVFKQLDDIVTKISTDVTNGGSENPTFDYGMANGTQITKNGNSYGITLADGTTVSASKDLGLVYGQDYGKGVSSSVANINNALKDQKIEELGGTDNAAVSAYLAQQEEAARLQKIADDKSDDRQAVFQQENLDRYEANKGKPRDGFLTDLAGAGQSLLDLGGNVYDDISSGYNYLKDTITGDKGYEDATLFADVGSGYPLGDFLNYGEGMGEGQDEIYIGVDGTYNPIGGSGSGNGGNGGGGNGGGGNGGGGNGGGGNGGGGNGGGGDIPATPVITPPPVIPVDVGTSIPGVGVPVVNPITPSGPGVIPGLDPITGANPYLVESTKDYGKDPRFENLAPNFLVSKSAMPIFNREDPVVPLPVVEEIEEETSLLAQGGIVSLQDGGDPSLIQDLQSTLPDFLKKSKGASFILDALDNLDELLKKGFITIGEYNFYKEKQQESVDNSFPYPEAFSASPEGDSELNDLPLEGRGFSVSPEVSSEQESMDEFQKLFRRKQSLERDPTGMIQLMAGGGEPMDQIAKDFYINLIPRALTEKDGGGLARKIAGVHGKYGLGIDEETFHALKYYRGPGGGMKNGGVAGRGYTHEGIGGLSDTARNMFRPMVS